MLNIMFSTLLGLVFFLFFLTPFSYTLSYKFEHPLSPPDKLLQQPDKPKIRITDENDFRIAIFSDLHYGEKENSGGDLIDMKSTAVLGNVLDSEKPHFVVFNGDFITGDDTQKHNSTAYLDLIVAPVAERNYNWASTYGNHDTQYNLDREKLFETEARYKNSYTQHSVRGLPGVTNYWIPIYGPSKPTTASTNETSTEEEEEVPKLILWFFDSLGGEKYQRRVGRSMPNWVEDSVSAWYTMQSSLLVAKYNTSIPSLAFVHIPPSNFNKAQKSNWKKRGGRKNQNAFFPGLDEEKVSYQGNDRDGVKDQKFTEALRKMGGEGGLKAIFSGHDHGNSWCGTWDGQAGSQLKNTDDPKICYVKHTGYGGYGDYNRGSRILGLKFKEEGNKTDVEVDTWLRMENGNVVQRVSLNSTYGADVYPIEDGED